MKYIILLLLFATGCSSITQQLQSEIYYKRDMRITVNGHEGLGVVVVPKADSYTFEIEARGNLDMFTFNTCHRDETRESAWDSGWFKSKKRIELTYTPSPDMELTGSCPVVLGAYEVKKGRHSFGFVDFQDEAHTLPAVLRCNGVTIKSPGVSVCQSKVGLIQEIIFDVEVITVSDEAKCPQLLADDSKRFRYYIPRAECEYLFMEKNAENKSHRLHKLTTMGHEKILIRRDK